MKSTAHALGLIALFASHSVAATPKVVLEPPVQVAHTDVAIALDAQGHVTDIHPVTGWAPAVVTDRLSELTRRLTFSTDDGAPMPKDAVVRFTLATQPLPHGQVAMRIEHMLVIKSAPVSQSGANATEAAAPSTTPAVTIQQAERGTPRYPPELEKRRIEGDVLVGLQLAPDGTVSTVSVLQSDLRNVRGSLNGIAGLVAQMEQAAVEAAKRWTFHIEAAPGIKPTQAQLRGIATITYRALPPPSGEGRPLPTGIVAEEQHAGTTWLTLVRTAYRPPSWSSGDVPDGLDIVDFDGADWYPIQVMNLHPSNDLIDVRL